MFELVDRAAVQRGGRDDVIAGRQQREQGRRLRRDAAGECDRAAAAFEVGHALFEHKRLMACVRRQLPRVL